MSLENIITGNKTCCLMMFTEQHHMCFQLILTKKSRFRQNKNQIYEIIKTIINGYEKFRYNRIGLPIIYITNHQITLMMINIDKGIILIT